MPSSSPKGAIKARSGAVVPARAIRLSDAWGDECGTVAGIEFAGAAAMIAEGLRERDATVRLDDDHAPGDDPDELDEDLRALVISGWACCPSGVRRPSRAAWVSRKRRRSPTTSSSGPTGRKRRSRHTSPRRSSRSLPPLRRRPAGDTGSTRRRGLWHYSTSDYHGDRIILRRLGSVPDSGAGPNAGSYGRPRAAVAVLEAGMSLQGPTDRADGPSGDQRLHNSRNPWMGTCTSATWTSQAESRHPTRGRVRLRSWLSPVSSFEPKCCVR